jgi:hypothetical protein
MEGWLKALIAGACIVVITAGAVAAWQMWMPKQGRYSKLLADHERATERFNRANGTNIKAYVDE